MMAQCWLIFFFIRDIECNLQLYIIVTLMVLVYEFFQVWCFQAIKFIISFEMESLYGNSILLPLNALASFAISMFLGYDPLFSTRY